MNLSRKPLILGLALLLLPTFAACGGPTETRVPVVQVSGKASFEGKPPEGAQIVLNPVGTSLPEGTRPVGAIKSDGTFQISTYGQGDGAPPGEYVATIQWFKLITQGDHAGSRGPNVLPKKYASTETSPIKLSIPNAATELAPIVISK